MIKILVISDCHIHDRADEIPRELNEIISANAPFDISIYAGDFVDRDVYEWFVTTGIQTYAVEGNMDYLPLEEEQKIFVYDLKIGVIHGHQVRPRGNVVKLTEIAKEMGVNILVSGHTHSPFVTVNDGVLHVNPGSLTGVWGGGGGSMRPSMMIMYVDQNRVEIRHYELAQGRVSERTYRLVYGDNTWVMLR